ncbi:MAG: hypothetical protein EAZ44_08465, partial [Cytophagia bacterium]
MNFIYNLLNLYRNYTTVALIMSFLFLEHFAKAQSTSGIAFYDQYKTNVANIISTLDKTQIPTGFLHEFGYPAFHPSHVAGTRLDSNQISTTQWQVAYSSIQSMYLYGINTLPNLTTVQNQLKTYRDNTSNSIAFSILSARFVSVKDNALTSNLLSRQGNQLFDVVGRTQSPYQNQEAFLVAPVKSEFIGLQVSFIFRLDLLFSNYGLLANQIQTLQIDADNGQGWQNIVWNTPLQVNYIQEGNKLLKYRCTFSNGNIKEGHSYFKIKNPPLEVQRYSTVADFEKDFTGGKMSIVYSKKNTTSPKRLRKPLIVVEDFDEYQIAPLIKNKNYDLADFVRQIQQIDIQDPLNPTTGKLDGLIDDVGGYDLVFLDYADGSASLGFSQAPFFEQVLEYVYTNKVSMPNGIREKNVVLGLGLGGIIARYSLTWFARSFISSLNERAKDTRLIITHDSPHRGANIPLGAQALIRQFADVPLFPGISLASQLNKIEQAVRVLDSPATRDMLLYRATSATGGVEYNDYISNGYQYIIQSTNNIPFEVVATSMGSECGIWNAAGNATLMNGGFWEDGGIIGLSYHFSPTMRALPYQGGTNELASLKVNRRFWGWIVVGASGGGFFGIVGGVVGAIIGTVMVIVDEAIPIYNKSFIAPSNLLFLDGAQGGTKLSRSFLNIPNGGLGYPTRQVAFVPTASALDYPLTEYNLLHRKYSHSYTESNTQNRIKKYITQEPTSNSTSDGVTVPNLEHNQNFTPRLGLWMFRTMENISTAQQICNRPCPPSGLPELSLNKGLLCVGERISFLNNTGIWTGITVTSSANLGFDNATKQIEALSEGYAWINASIRLGDC